MFFLGFADVQRVCHDRDRFIAFARLRDSRGPVRIDVVGRDHVDPVGEESRLGLVFVQPLPVHAERVALHDGSVRLERQELQIAVQNLRGRLHHLVLGDPKRSFGHVDGEVVDFDAVELVDVHVDLELVAEDVESAVAPQTELHALVLQLAQAGVGLGEEVARVARRVEELERAELALEGLQFLVARLDALRLANGGELRVQIVHEKGIDDLVDVLDAGVMHAALAARLGVQRAFEHGPENGRTDFAPVEAEARARQKDFRGLFRNGRNRLALFFAEERPVHIGELGQLLFHETVPFFQRRVKRAEKLAKRHAHVLGTETLEIAVELFLCEDAGVFGVEAEHQTNAENVEGVEVRSRGLFAELRQERVVNLAHDLARLDGDLQLALEAVAARVHQELQASDVAFEVLQQNLLRVVVRLFHVIDQELLEIACDNPLGMLGKGQLSDVFLGLLKRGEERAVALPDGRKQVLTARLLLDHHSSGWNQRVDELGDGPALEPFLDLFLEEYALHDVFDAEDAGQQIDPEFLSLALFVTMARPSVGKIPGGLLQFVRLLHRPSSLLWRI